MIYFTSDLHLLRPEKHIFSPRGYNDYFKMAEDYIRKINQTVGTEDVLYILGDVLGGNLEEAVEMFKQIKCNIYIINGNYETKEAKVLLSKTGKIRLMSDALAISLKGYKFYLSHYPCRTGDFSLIGDPVKRKIWNLCGHTHTPDMFKEMRLGWPAYHVEVDAHDGYPITIDQIVNDIEYFTSNDLPPIYDWSDSKIEDYLLFAKENMGKQNI